VTRGKRVRYLLGQQKSKGRELIWRRSRPCRFDKFYNVLRRGTTPVVCQKIDELVG